MKNEPFWKPNQYIFAEAAGLEPTHHVLGDYWRLSRPLPYTIRLMLPNMRIAEVPTPIPLGTNCFRDSLEPRPIHYP